MADVLRSLPQGLYWYPVVLVLLGLLAASVVSLRGGPGEKKQGAAPKGSAFALAADLAARARTDAIARLELERRLIGLLLQAHGYRGYSVDYCRHYAEHGASPEATRLLLDHLDDGPSASQQRAGALPQRIDELMSLLEKELQEQQ